MARAVTLVSLLTAAVLVLCACRSADDSQRRQSGTASGTPAGGTSGARAGTPAGSPAASGTAGAPATRPSTRPAGSMRAAAASTRPTAFTGTLRGSAVAIGGETTGWRLEGDGATGGMDVDVSKVRQRAQALDGKRVSVTGRMTTRSWPERGETQVLVADAIEEAPAPAAPGAR